MPQEDIGLPRATFHPLTEALGTAGRCEPSSLHPSTAMTHLATTRAEVWGFPPSLSPGAVSSARNRAGLRGKQEREQSSSCAAGPAGSMEKKLRVKSINSFITELLRLQRYCNCACWEVLTRETSHFHRGPQR